MKSGPRHITAQEARALKQLGPRLTRLRRLRHLTQTELARRIGMRPGPVNAIECGRHLPTLTVSVRLAQALDVPLQALLSDAYAPYVCDFAGVNSNDTGPRSGKSADSDAKGAFPPLFATDAPASPAARMVQLVPAVHKYAPAVLSQLEDLVHSFLTLEDLCGVPKRAAIPLRLAMPHTEQGIEDFAMRVRGLLGIGPAVIFDYLELFENAGLRIVFCRLPPEIQSAACYDAQSDNAFLFISNHAAINTERRLFHLILELGRIYCFTGELRQVKRRAKPLDAEHDACKFAAFFLMPAEAMYATVRQVGVPRDGWTWELLLRLKHRFGVSAETFLYRLGELDLIAPKTLADLKTRIQAHYAATHNAEPDGSRRILSPNGRLGDLLLMSAARREHAAIRRTLARHGVQAGLPPHPLRSGVSPR